MVQHDLYSFITQVLYKCCQIVTLNAKFYTNEFDLKSMSWLSTLVVISIGSKLDTGFAVTDKNVHHTICVLFGDFILNFIATLKCNIKI